MTSDPWSIIPYVGVGPIRFGLSRAQARALVEGAPSTFRQGPYAISETDAYEQLYLHLYYDSADRLRCIMAFGSNPIHYKHIALLNRRLQAVLADLASHLAFGVCELLVEAGQAIFKQSHFLLRGRNGPFDLGDAGITSRELLCDLSELPVQRDLPLHRGGRSRPRRSPYRWRSAQATARSALPSSRR